MQCRVRDWPLRPELTIVSGAGRHDRSQFLLVQVSDGDGCRGFGEAATTPLWSGEWAPAGRDIVERLLAPVVLGRNIDHPEQVADWMDGAVVGLRRIPAGAAAGRHRTRHDGRRDV